MKKISLLLFAILFWSCNSNDFNPNGYIEPDVSGVYTGMIAEVLPSGSLQQAINNDSVLYTYVTLGSFDSVCTVSSFNVAVKFSSKASDTSTWFSDTSWSLYGGDPSAKTGLIQVIIYDSIERARGYTFKDSIVANSYGPHYTLINDSTVVTSYGYDTLYVFPTLEYRITKVCP